MKRRENTGRHALAAAAAFLLALLIGAQAGAEKVLTLTFTGDCTLGCEERLRGDENSFEGVLKKKGTDWFLANFREMFAQDDCTVVNLEGVLSDSSLGEKTKEKVYRFRGDTDYVRILQDTSVEAAGLANNHILDYDKQGLRSTVETLEAAGIGWFRGMDTHTVEKDGIRIVLFAVDEALYLSQPRQYLDEMRRLKESGEANAIVLLLHSGNEYDAKHTDYQRKIAENAVKYGTDLVITHHPHVVQGIHLFNNRTVLYSLGNFVFGGNSQIRTEVYYRTRKVSSLYSIVVQAKLYFHDDGTYKGQQILLYPAYTSTAELPVNNYQPRRITAEEAEPVMEAIRFDTSDFELPSVTTDEDGLAVAVLSYLPADEEAAEGGIDAAADGAPEPAGAKPER